MDCPVCNSPHTEAQHDYPHMSECHKCGSEWINEGMERFKLRGVIYDKSDQIYGEDIDEKKQ